MTPLKRWLVENEKTARWLAQQVGCDENGLSHVVNGKRVPMLPLAIQIARTTGSSVEELFGYVADSVDARTP